MSDLLTLIQERHSTRVAFDPGRPVDRGALRQIVEAARWAPTAHNMQNFEIVVVDDARTLEALGRVNSRVSAEFLRENYAQLSSSREELRRKKVGVLGAAFPPPWRDPSRFEDLAREGAPAPLAQTINGSPALLVVVYDPSKRAPASERDVLGMISLGCVMENMWLTAESLGIAFQIMSVFAGGEVEGRVKRILHVPSDLRIAYAVRLGYPGSRAGYLRVRRSARAVAHYNRYGAPRRSSTTSRASRPEGEGRDPRRERRHAARPLVKA